MATQKSSSKSAAKGKASKLAPIKTIKALFGGAKKKAEAAEAKAQAKKPAPKAGAAKASAAKPAKATAVKAPKAEAKGAKAPVKAPVKVKAAEKEAPKKAAVEKAAPAPVAAKPAKAAKPAPAIAKIVAEAESVCREVACEGLATSAGYCRLHYIKNWKKIKRKELILKEGKLNQYIEELVAKYPDKYIEAIRQDLAADKEFAKVIYDLDLDESVDEFDAEAEGQDAIIDSIKRDFDDEGDTGF